MVDQVSPPGAGGRDSSDAPSLRESERFGPDDPAVLACLAAAKTHGLAQRYIRGAIRVSRHPDYGWWGRKSYGASMDVGGPWSVEFIHRMCELGLISLDPQAANSAALTKAGRALLRERLGIAGVSTRKDGSSQKDHPQHQEGRNGDA